MTDNINWLKIVGCAILTHIILILLSILTLFIYSVTIDSGHSEEFYAKFAQASGPYVSSIGGFILIYWFVLRLNKGKTVNPFVIGLGLPIIYVIIDFAVIIVFVPDWSAGINILLISNGIKLLAGIIAAYSIKRSRRIQ